ncbi:hypothetical protein JYX54_001053 [Campylobacter coli]|nr:hypothetical protein [Campylobacter coli]
MSFICLLQADDSAKTLNLLDKRQQQLHIQKEFDELEKKQQQEKDVYLENCRRKNKMSQKKNKMSYFCDKLSFFQP